MHSAWKGRVQHSGALLVLLPSFASNAGTLARTLGTCHIPAALPSALHPACLLPFSLQHLEGL